LAKTQLEELTSLVIQNSIGHGEEIIARGEGSSYLLMLWLDHLRSTQLTGNADCLLDGATSAVREGVSCLALGLVRPALNSIRLQIDLVLAWLYFKDHKVEWDRVQETGDGYKLKSDIFKYLCESHKSFNTRFSLLANCKSRTLHDPYRVLSAHIHGQSEPAIPKITMPIDIVASYTLQLQALELQKESAEYLNDILWCINAEHWTRVPEPLLEAITTRFKSPAQRVSFFESSLS
jgi:hypothetical protein